MKFAGILTKLIHEAEGLFTLNTGADKKAYVLNQIAELDDTTVFKFIPNGVEAQFLDWLVDYTVALVKNNKK